METSINLSAQTKLNSLQTFVANTKVGVIELGFCRFDQENTAEFIRRVEMYASLNQAVRPTLSTNLLIDMQNIEFISSHDLPIILSALSITKSAGISLALCSLQEPVKLLFEITRMDQKFAIFESRQAFVAHLESQALSHRVLAAA